MRLGNRELLDLGNLPRIYADDRGSGQAKQLRETKNSPLICTEDTDKGKDSGVGKPEMTGAIDMYYFVFDLHQRIGYYFSSPQRNGNRVIGKPVRKIRTFREAAYT